ncbi:MAG: molybdate ABC transporter permease subunit [Bacillota bacterium]|uniref:Molybdenum transport system permease n=1 Tax=Thermanaerosceptrum fracticalcis TaxID=1712410 RepID=A0A7G6E348_THEFR|nr:molybdate ABC transporter permease subunit [Thermanaerosceptrum fracticalcis]QNB46502.1 molybdate ABC transporter permease subunit [Thermanaerosceptrum fracticalcis]
MASLDLSPLWISAKTASTATVITFFLGIATARWMAGYKGGLKSILDGLFIAPLVLPPTVVGFILLLIFGKNGPIGSVLLKLGKTIIFSWQATVIAAAVVAFPIMYQTARGAFEQVDPNLENAARTLGASEWTIFWRITVPLVWPGIAAGTILSFARALGEFGATLMLAGNLPGKTQTAPVAIYFAVEAGDTSKALFYMLVIMGISLGMIFVLNQWKSYQDRVKV